LVKTNTFALQLFATLHDIYTGRVKSSLRRAKMSVIDSAATLIGLAYTAKKTYYAVKRYLNGEVYPEAKAKTLKLEGNTESPDWMKPNYTPKPFLVPYYPTTPNSSLNPILI
jgi:hypothetical protein